MATEETQQNVDVGNKLLSEINEAGYDLRIEAVNNQLECRASIKVHNLDNSIAPAELINLLKMLDIAEGINLEQVAVFCTEAAEGNDPQNILLAEGTPPSKGEDGWFELKARTGQEKTEFTEDENGRVDFKAVQTFTNIEVDQLIGIIHPPVPGTPGKTVTGTPIPALQGRAATLIPGDGVRISKDGTEVFATKPGRVVFDNRYITIAEELSISGDVDLKVGNIEFNGFVNVSGDVLDDFHIKATKGVNVSGTVGACMIDSDGPVTVGSVAGMGLGRIRCKGNFEARYLNQATIECWGNVRVTYEIRNSIVKATGLVSIESGIISGGETTALEGIEAKIIGTSAGAKTYLTSGVYFPETDRLQYLRTRTKSVAYQIKRISTSLIAMKKKPLDKMRKALREATELRMNILNERQEKLTVEQQDLAEELAAFQQTDHPTANAKINVQSSVKEGVIFTLGETTEEIKFERSGPVSIIENSQQNGLKFLTQSPLKISAQKMQEEAAEEEAKQRSEAESSTA